MPEASLLKSDSMLLSARSSIEPVSLSTITLLSSTDFTPLPEATMPTMHIIAKIPMIRENRIKPTIVANTILKNSFIFLCFWNFEQNYYFFS